MQWHSHRGVKYPLDSKKKLSKIGKKEKIRKNQGKRGKIGKVLSLYPSGQIMLATLLCRRKAKICQPFSKVSKLNCHFHIWIHHEKYIKMSTNKPSVGTVVLEIVTTEISKKKKFQISCFPGALILSWCVQH